MVQKAKSGSVQDWMRTILKSRLVMILLSLHLAFLPPYSNITNYEIRGKIFT